MHILITLAVWIGVGIPLAVWMHGRDMPDGLDRLEDAVTVAICWPLMVGFILAIVIFNFPIYLLKLLIWGICTALGKKSSFPSYFED